MLVSIFRDLIAFIGQGEIHPDENNCVFGWKLGKVLDKATVIGYLHDDFFKSFGIFHGCSIQNNHWLVFATKIKQPNAWGEIITIEYEGAWRVPSECLQQAILRQSWEKFKEEIEKIEVLIGFGEQIWTHKSVEIWWTKLVMCPNKKAA